MAICTASSSHGRTGSLDKDQPLIVAQVDFCADFRARRDRHQNDLRPLTGHDHLAEFTSLFGHLDDGYSRCFSLFMLGPFWFGSGRALH